MAAVNGRELVLDMLLMVEKEEEYSHRLIQDVLSKYDYLETVEKSFIKRLFEGTLERRIELDYYIDRVSSTPVRKMKPVIRNLLRLGVYQIYYMDSIRDAAAVNEAVKLAAKRKFVNLKGFVNGVLRKAASTKGSIALPDKEKEYPGYLSVKYSMPEWIVEHFLSQFSKEKTESLLEGMLRVRPLTIRFALDMGEEEKEKWLREVRKRGVNPVVHTYVKEAYYLENCDNVTLLPGFDEGRFTIMDASSMEAVKNAHIKPGDFVVDICAAPGGKAMLAAEYAGKEGLVSAWDVREGKVSLIEENAERMKLTNLKAKVWDATVFDESVAGKADVVICDVPCSGLGVMGRKRDIKYRQKPEALKSLPILQKKMVENAVRYLKEGGYLLYSTCTINRAENEEVVEYIRENLNLTVECMTALYPDEHDTDGFFFARCKK